MKYLVVLLSFFSVNFYSSSQDLSWGISLETGINLNKQEDFPLRETNPLFYTAVGTHIKYRLKNRFFVKSGIYLNRVNHDSYSINEDYSYYNYIIESFVTAYDSISVVSNSNSLVIPLGISIDVIKGLNVDLGLSVVRTAAKEEITLSSFDDYYIESPTSYYLNEIVETSVNNIYVGVNYTFDNGLGIGFKHVFVNRPNYFNEIETISSGFNTLTLSYDISQYKWM